MLKQLQFEDVPKLLVFLRDKNQRDLFDITEAEARYSDMRHWNIVMGQCIDSNCSFISVNDNKVDGIALGIVIPLIWSPNRHDMVMLALQGNNRITTAKLFKKWDERANALPNINRILVDSIDGTNINYDKIGYKKLRTTYSREV